MENQPGNGQTTPFGNGNGAPAQSGQGGHDFTKNPRGGGAAGRGRDFTKEGLRPQRTGAPPYNAQSVPAGGPLPFPAADPGAGVGPDGATVETPNAPRKPFRLNGEGAVGVARQPAPMAGEMPDEGY